MRETLTRVLRSYGLAPGDAVEAAARSGIASPNIASSKAPLPDPPNASIANPPHDVPLRTDCDFDADAWDRGDCHALAASGIGRVVMNRLPTTTASLSPQAGADSYAWRAVIGPPQDMDKAALQALHANGVRGIRFEITTVTSTGLDPMLRLADRVVPFGWHIELNVASFGAYRALSKAEWSLMQFPVAVCFSGLSGFRQGRRADDADIDFLLGMMQLGRYWLKLTSGDLTPTQLKLWDEPSPLATALAAVRKDRLIWGSGKQPTGDGTAYLSAGLAALEKCIPQPTEREAILIGNPATLYDF